MLNKTEILAPAGNTEAVKAAVNAYADAVYLGGSMFSARAFAGNFDEKELLDTIDYCHRFGVKVYMAINTLLKNEEIQRLPSYVEPYYRQGVDGIIVQDMGVVSVLGKSFPDLPLHGSTQLSVSSSQGVAFLKSIGMTRFVPSRELSLSEITEIKKNVDIEVETFVHGAMCYSYSGRCLMSSFAGGRSGNRGRCAQPCRKQYASNDVNEYMLSLKDMCMLKSLSRLIDAGIDSFKIEGRMKKPEYVAATVTAYREVRDAYLAGESVEKLAEEQEKKLLDIYNRGGFYSGYYYTSNGKKMLANSRPNHTGIKVGRVNAVEKPYVDIKLDENVSAGDVLEIRGRNGDVELTCNVAAKAGKNVRLKAKSFRSIAKFNDVYRTRNGKLLEDIQNNIINADRKIELAAHVSAYADQPLELKLSTVEGKCSVSVEGPVCTQALNKPVTESQIVDKIKKTGGTDYVLGDITADVSDNLCVQISAVNNLRREALEQLGLQISQSYRRDGGAVRTGLPGAERPLENVKNNTVHGVTVGVSDADHVNIVKNYKWVSNVIVDYNVRKYADELKQAGFRVILALPEILRQRELDRYSGLSGELGSFDGVMIRNYDELGILKKLDYKGLVIADASLYAYNDNAFDFYRENMGDVCFMCSNELTLDEIHGLSYDTLIKLYGHQKVMITANCIAGNYMNGCASRKMSRNVLTDDRGNRFYVRNYCAHCYNIIYNGVPTNMIDRLAETGISDKDCYIEFTIEDTNKVKDIMDSLELAMSGEKAVSMSVDQYTRGHYYKGID